MENKILIELIVPELEEKFDIFIPITKRVGNIIALLAKAISELGIDYQLTPSMGIYNRNTSQQYNPNELIYNTDIMNGSIIVLIS
jgi:hypothetical protein